MLEYLDIVSLCLEVAVTWIHRVLRLLCRDGPEGVIFKQEFRVVL